ncbi:acyl-CoA N-acyltransferase [Leptodontidium sp. MPI-SDFR-AT-0119]|nr:acyl-CoA N-acyltransferase [Leptodontidium sp. MPI-SDFR-AT-0119]
MRSKPQTQLKSQHQTHTTYPAPLILPAKREDIPRLVEIYILAEKRDLLTIFENVESSLITKWLIKLLDEQFDAPELRLMKAVDRDSGEITALAFWWLRGWGLEGKIEDKTGGEIEFERERERRFLFPPFLGCKTTRHKAVKEEHISSPLQKHIADEFAAFEDSWIVGTKCMNLSLLMTDPKYQRRGIGTALLQWGHERADREGVPCFLIASPAGHPLYVHVGWKVIGEPMEVDLKDWAEYASGGDMGWGTYRFYYMLRLPKNAKP